VDEHSMAHQYITPIPTAMHPIPISSSWGAYSKQFPSAAEGTTHRLPAQHHKSFGYSVLATALVPADVVDICSTRRRAMHTADALANVGRLSGSWEEADGDGQQPEDSPGMRIKRPGHLWWCQLRRGDCACLRSPTRCNRLPIAGVPHRSQMLMACRWMRTCCNTSGPIRWLCPLCACFVSEILAEQTASVACLRCPSRSRSRRIPNYRTECKLTPLQPPDAPSPTPHPGPPCGSLPCCTLALCCNHAVCILICAH